MATATLIPKRAVRELEGAGGSVPQARALRAVARGGVFRLALTTHWVKGSLPQRPADPAWPLDICSHVASNLPVSSLKKWEMWCMSSVRT